jgi:sulfotransferase family protein
MSTVFERVMSSPYMHGSLRRAWVRRRAELPETARIFGIGLTRTATSSLTVALERLGYWSVHYPEDPLTRGEVLAFLANGGARLRLSILERRLDALTDTPVCVSFEALDAAYPGSKFILTTRDKDSWLDSCSRFWEKLVDRFLTDQPDHPGAKYIKALHERLYGTASFDPERFSAAYDRYQRRVHEHFRDRRDDLLVLDICGGDRWDPLCDFFCLPRPRAEFPWVNRIGPPSASAGSSPAAASPSRLPGA